MMCTIPILLRRVDQHETPTVVAVNHDGGCHHISVDFQRDGASFFTRAMDPCAVLKIIQIQKPNRRLLWVDPQDHAVAQLDAWVSG